MKRFSRWGPANPNGAAWFRMERPVMLTRTRTDSKEEQMRIRAPSPRWSDWPMILRQPANWDQRRNGERLLKEHQTTSTTATTGPEGCETYRVQGHDLHRLLSRLTEYPKESLGPIPLLDTRRRPVSTCAYPWRRLSPERVTYRWRLRGGANTGRCA